VDDLVASTLVGLLCVFVGFFLFFLFNHPICHCYITEKVVVVTGRVRSVVVFAGFPKLETDNEKFRTHDPVATVVVVTVVAV
jgi:hypothetical protein